MSSNPLDSAIPSSTSGPRYGETQSDVRAFCEEKNQEDGAWARTLWYFAIAQRDDTHRFEAVRVDGHEAEEIRKAVRGVFPDYAGWSADKMRQHIGLVKYRLQMGMSESSFQSIVARWPRAAGIGQGVEETPTQEQSS